MDTLVKKVGLNPTIFRARRNKSELTDRKEKRNEERNCYFLIIGPTKTPTIKPMTMAQIAYICILLVEFLASAR